MCCSWAEAADAALLEITLLHARRQREKLLSRALSAQPALSARRGGRGGPALPLPHSPLPTIGTPGHHGTTAALACRGCCQRLCGFRGCSAAAVVGCPCCPTVCMGQPSCADPRSLIAPLSLSVGMRPLKQLASVHKTGGLLGPVWGSWGASTSPGLLASWEGGCTAAAVVTFV